VAQRTEAETEPGFRPQGPKVVAVLYVLVVGVGGVTGYLLGSFGISGMRSVTFLGLIEIPPTPVGLALYGMGTLGFGLGVAIMLVAYVSRRYA
jgi:hypothetical protein